MTIESAKLHLGSVIFCIGLIICPHSAAANMPNVTDGNPVNSTGEETVGSDSKIIGVASGQNDSRFIIDDMHELTGYSHSQLSISGIQDNLGTLEIKTVGAFTTEGRVLVNAHGQIINEGEMTNKGTISFMESSLYSGAGSIDNKDGILNLHGGMANGGATNILYSLSSDMGEIIISGNLGENTYAALDNVSSGTISIEKQTSTVVGDFTFVTAAGIEGIIGGADLTCNGGIFSGAIAAKNIFTNGDNVFASYLGARSYTVLSGTTDFHFVSPEQKSDYTIHENATLRFFGERDMPNNSYLGDGKTMINSGTVEFHTSFVNEGEILNNETGNVIFKKSSTYTKASAASVLNNKGLLTIDAETKGIETLFQDINLLSGSTLSLVADGNTSMKNDLLLKGAQTGSQLCLGSNGKTLTINKLLDAKNADIRIQAGQVTLAYTTRLAGESVTLDGGATLKVLQKISSDTIYPHIQSDRITIKGTLDIGYGNTLTVGNTANSSLTFANGSSLSLAAYGTFRLSSLNATGKVLIEDNVLLDISGASENIIGKTFLTTEKGITGRFLSPLYNVTYQNNRAFIASRNAVLPALSGSLNLADLSGNKWSGGNYADRALDALAAVDVNALGAYIQLAATMPELGNRAVGQLFAEYGAYASQPVILSGEQFFRVIGRQIKSWQDAISSPFFPPASDSIAQSNSGYGSLVPQGCSVRVQGGGYDYCINRTRIWAGGTGAWSDQNDRNGVAGFDYRSGGFAVGAEYQLGRFLLGVAGGYDRGKLDVDDLKTTFDADIMNLGLYGAYQHESGFYGKTDIGFSQGWNDYDVDLVLGGVKRGKYKNQVYLASLEVGYLWNLPGSFIISPSAGVNYRRICQDAWSENVDSRGGAPGVANYFTRSKRNLVEIPLALRVGRVFSFKNARFAPEINAAWIYSASDNQPRIDTGFQNMQSTVRMLGANTGRNRWLLGAAVTANFNRNIDSTLEYRFEKRSASQNHNVSVNMGVSF